MRRVVVSPQAEQDLIDIWLYIAEDQPINADHFLDRLETQVSKLAEFVDMGVARDELAEALKSFPVGRYILFYRVTQEGVELVRVLHSSRDVKLIF